MSLKTDFPDGLARCGWLDGSADYTAYHDLEWGRPVADDRALFEQLSLEGFQSGLSWRTILNKREAFRRGFPVSIRRAWPATVKRDPGAAGRCRHRAPPGQDRSRDQQRGPGAGNDRARGLPGGIPVALRSAAQGAVNRGASVSEQSQALSKALKKLGWKFVGPTTVYAFMQSVGMVNDHDPGCHCHAASERARREFARPGQTG